MNQQQKDVQQIIKEHPELVTTDPEVHTLNLSVYGTSILYQKNQTVPGETYGKGPLRNVMEGRGDLVDDER